MSETQYRPDAWWPSKLNDYRQCLRYGKLKHVDRLPMESGGLDAEFGTAVHLAINDVLLGGNGQDIFDMYFSPLQGRADLKRFKYGWEALNEMAPVFLRKFKRGHASKFKPFLMEERIFGKIGDEAAEGTPDFLGDYDGVPSGVDFKTSSSKYEKGAIESHSQIEFYAHLAQQQLDFFPTQKVLYVFVKGTDPSIQVLKTELTKAKLYDTVLNIKAEIALYKNGAGFPKNLSACVRGPIVCPGFKYCFPDGVTKGE
jgi:hypothetical protein